MTQDNSKKMRESNRKAWNEVMPLHQEAAAKEYDNRFKDKNFSCLSENETKWLRSWGLEGKAVAQLCCNNGVELLSIKNLGAQRCVGFDISDAAVEEATKRAELTGISCEYHRRDIYEIEEQWAGQFDLVYVSAGAIGWMDDLVGFFAKAAMLLKKGGSILIDEIHPVSEVLPFDDSDKAGELVFMEPYFQEKPVVEYGGLDYVGGKDYESDIAQYWFVHSLAEVFTALIQNGFHISHFKEFPKDVSGGHSKLEEAEFSAPLSMLIGAEKWQ